MAKLTQIRAWFKSLPSPWRTWRIVGYVAAGDEIPEELPYRGVVLVGTERQREMGSIRLSLQLRASAIGEP